MVSHNCEDENQFLRCREGRGFYPRLPKETASNRRSLGEPLNASPSISLK